MYAWSYKYVYMGISTSTKSKVYLHVQGKFWPTLINESLTVTHDIRKLADCMRKELNLKHQSLGAHTSAMANTRTRATVAGVPSSPCVGRIRKGRSLLYALTSATWPAQTPSTMAFVGQWKHCPSRGGRCKFSMPGVQSTWSGAHTDPPQSQVACTATFEGMTYLPISLSFNFIGYLGLSPDSQSMLDH